MAHRLREFWQSANPDPALNYGGVSWAFVLVPWVVGPAVQLQAAVLYRVAFEQAQAEVARERRARWTAFSLN